MLAGGFGSRVTGIFVDHLRDMAEMLRGSGDPDFQFPVHAIGVCHSSEAETRINDGAPFVIEHPPRHVFTSLAFSSKAFSTTGLLRNIKALCIQSRENHRYFVSELPRMGLKIHYQDDRPDCHLGQWDPSELSSITKIYDHEQGEFESLFFQMHETFVKDIFANRPPGLQGGIYFSADDLAVVRVFVPLKRV